MEFEWDQVKSENNTQKRNLPFELAIYLFDGPVIQHVDDRQDYGEVRIRAIGLVAGQILHCVYTDRADTRRIISLRYADRKERDAYRAAYKV
jgi:uncharacterized DUF497 family protein